MSGELDALIAAVDAGGATEFQFFTWRPGLTGTKKESRTMMKAYNGDLNAAKALHDALLPGWHFAIQPTGVTVIRLDHPHDGMVFDGSNQVTARAWLLAILRAYHAMLTK